MKETAVSSCFSATIDSTYTALHSVPRLYSMQSVQQTVFSLYLIPYNKGFYECELEIVHQTVSHRPMSTILSRTRKTNILQYYTYVLSTGFCTKLPRKDKNLTVFILHSFNDNRVLNFKFFSFVCTTDVTNQHT